MTFDGIVNLRDLVEVPLANGRRIIPGKLLRSAHLAHATGSDVARLQAMGLSAVLDFRDPVEQEKRPDVPIPGAAWYGLPAFCPLDPPPGMTREQQNAEFHRDPDRFLDFAYTYMVDGENALTAWRTMFQILMEANGAPVLWHCKQGKDRTGIAAILILTALGADLEAAKADFLRTNQVMQPEYDRMLREDPSSITFLERYLFVSPRRLDLFLEKAGDLTAYLEDQLGVGPKERQLLQYYYTTN